jgi:hypothetical protein
MFRPKFIKHLQQIAPTNTEIVNSFFIKLNNTYNIEAASSWVRSEYNPIYDIYKTISLGIGCTPMVTSDSMDYTLEQNYRHIFWKFKRDLIIPQWVVLYNKPSDFFEYANIPQFDFRPYFFDTSLDFQLDWEIFSKNLKNNETVSTTFRYMLKTIPYIPEYIEVKPRK